MLIHHPGATGPAYEVSVQLLSYKVRDDNMIRTQVSLDEKEYAQAKKEARVLGISVAEYVRRAIRETLPSRGGGAWMRYAGFVESGDPRSSRSIDGIVYGAKD
jgi:ribbon-helix-helix CopG family protein